MKYRLLTKAEACEIARISQRQMELLVRSGRGPVVTRIGGKFLVRDDHLSEWLDGLAVPSASKAA